MRYLRRHRGKKSSAETRVSIADAVLGIVTQSLITHALHLLMQVPNAQPLHWRTEPVNNGVLLSLSTACPIGRT